jgi:GDSL-like Lipase/Acylhydrolase
MKNITNYTIAFAASVALLGSCKPELAIPTASKGDLNLTSYVSIGNSLTAGYQDNGLTYEGQKSSYVNQLANQFKLVQPDLVFNTPFLDPNSAGCGAPSISILPPLDINNPAALIASTFTLSILVTAPYTLQTVSSPCGEPSLAPAPGGVHGDPSVIFDPSTNGYDANMGGVKLTFAGLSLLTGGFPAIKTAPSIYAASGPFQNMGVSGARCIDVNKAGFGGDNLITLSGLTNITQSNPFFSRFAKNKATSSMLSDAMIMKPSFFSLFIGNNDVLLWASQGGATGVGTSSVTPVSEFSDSIKSIVKTLMTTAQQGIIVNVPQITGAAFFTYMKPDVTKYIVDENGTIRLMKTDDMLLLTVPQDSLKCALGGSGGFGSATYPIPKKYTLTANQVTMATNAIDGYNAYLKSIADEKGLAFFDMNGFTKANQNGSHYNGMEITGTFVTGGLFSLDGLHLTPRGYAAVANEMVKAINNRYHSTLPGIDLTTYNGVNFGQ